MGSRRRNGNETRVGLLVALLLFCGILVPGEVAAAAGRTVAPAASIANSASGHYHALGAPKRIASSLAGSGFASGPLAANASRVIHVAGHGGIPSSNVLAVAVTVTAVKPSGSTTLSVGPGPDKPAVPSLTTPGGTASSFAIVPVQSSDSIEVWNGTAATDVTVDAVGWFASDGDSGTSGLMTRLADRKIAGATLAPGATKKVTLAGKGDVPGTNVGAALLRLRTTGARRSGTLGLASSAKKLGTSTAFAYPKGAGQDLALPKLSSGGAVVLKNRGKRKVKVAIDAVSSFSSGNDPEAFGDTLNVVAPVQVASADAASHTSPLVAAVAGIGDIPAEASTVPPSFVLLRALAAAPTSAGVLSVVAENALPGVSSLRLRVTKPSAGMVPAQPSSESKSAFIPSKGSTQISAEAYAYFAGGTVMDPDFRTLSAADLAAIQTDPTPDSVTFSAPVPSDLNDLAVGDVISAGVSDHTPSGFLRTVTAIDNSGSDLVVQTEDAGLADAVEHAHLSWGAGANAPAPSQAKSAQTSRQRSAARAAASSGVDGAKCTPDLFWVGASVDCGIHANENGASIDVSANFRLDWQGSIDVGLLGVHMTSAITVSGSLGGMVSAGAGPSELKYDKNIYRKFLECPQSTNIPVTLCSISPFPPLGPLDLWITPVLSLDLKVSGHIDGGLSAQGSVADSATANFDSHGGHSLQINQPSFDGSLTHSITKATADVKVALTPSADFYLTFAPITNLYRDKLIDKTIPSTKLSASVPIYLRFEADACAVRGFFGVDLAISLGLRALGKTLVDLTWKHSLVDKEIFDHPWRNCAYWSGTLVVNERYYYDNQLPDDNGHVRNAEKGTSNLTIHAPKDQEPPEDGFYHEKGTGTGINVQKTWLDCYAGGNHHYFPFTTKVNWGGAETVDGAKADFYFDQQDSSRLRYFLNGPNPGSLGADWQRTVTYLAQDLFGGCATQETHDQGKYWGSNVWSLIENHQSSRRLFFEINPKTGHAHGERHVPGTDQQPNWVVTYDLQKHCTKSKDFKC
jgi:hypothetical protein